MLNIYSSRRTRIKDLLVVVGHMLYLLLQKTVAFPGSFYPAIARCLNPAYANYLGENLPSNQLTDATIVKCQSSKIPFSQWTIRAILCLVAGIIISSQLNAAVPGLLIKSPSANSTVPLYFGTPPAESLDYKGRKDAYLAFTFTIPVVIPIGNIGNTAYVHIANYDTDALIAQGNLDKAIISGNTVYVPIVYGTSINDLMPEGQSFYVVVSGSTFADASNPTDFFPGSSSKSFWKLTRRANDGNGPTPVSFSPAAGQQDASLNRSFSIEFDEPVFYKYDNSAGLYVITAPSGSPSYRTDLTIEMSADHRTITFIGTPGQFLSKGTNYWMQLNAGRLYDADGNFYAITNDSQWTFKTYDAFNPVSFFPAKNTANLPLDQMYTVTMNNDLDVSGWLEGTGITARRAYDDYLQEYVYVSSDQVQVSGNVLSVSFTDLEPLTTYYISTGTNVIRDAYGQFYDPDETWRFSTGAASNSAPTNITLSASNTNENNAVNAVVGTLSTTDSDAGNTFTYTLVAGTGSTDNLSFNINGSQLRASQAFDYETKDSYSIRVRTTDQGGLFFEKPFTITINDVNDTPTDIALSSTAIAENNSVNAIVGTLSTTDADMGDSFTYSLVPGTGSTDNASFNISGNKLRASIVFDFETKTSYSIRIRTNDGLATFDEQFVIKINNQADQDIEAPVLLSRAPLDKATGVSIYPSVSLNFDETIVEGTGNIVIYRYSDDAVHRSFPMGLASPYVNVNGSQLQLFIGNEFDQETKYYVTVCATCIEDESGNSFSGIANKTDWTFTTGEFISPDLQSLSPLSGATGVARNADLVLTFDEALTLSEGESLTIRYASNDQAWATYTVPSPYLTVSGSTLTINPPADLPAGTGFYVEIPDGVITDLSDNSFGGIEAGDWSFTTISTPQVQSFFPAHGSTDSPAMSSYTLAFDRPVSRGSTGNLRFYRKSDGTFFKNYSYNSEAISFEGNVVSFKEDGVPLAAGTEYYVTIQPGFVVDANDPSSAFGGMTTNTAWNFTTRANDGDGPTIAALSPSNGATGVHHNGLNLSFTITYDEPVYTILSSSYVGLYRENPAGDEYFYNIGVNKTVSEDRLSVTFDIPNNYNLQLGSEYYILMDELNVFSQPYIFDIDGNAAPAITDEETWRFQIHGAPEIVSFSPADDAIDVPVNSVFSFTTNYELGSSGSGNIVLAYYPSGTLAKSLPSSSDKIVITGNEVTVDFGTLAYDTQYAILISYGLFKDVFGENVIPPASGGWTFTTEAAPLQAQTITFNTLPAKTFGDASFGLSATASSGLPVSYTSSNSSVATISGSTVTIVGAGAATITASQAGNASYTAATSVQRTLTVNKANQILSFAALPDKVFGDANFSLPATASSGLTVSYASSNTAVATISGSTVTIVGTGTTSITASQEGNGNYHAATNKARTLTVDAASQTISFAELPAKTYGAADFTLSATASSGLPVSFASSNSAVATLSGSTVTIVGAGSTTITASQAGNASYTAAPNVQRTLTVNKANQTLNFAALPDKEFGDASFDLDGTASSSLTVSYISSNTGVATISGSTVTIVGAGTTNITASQAGNGNYNAAIEVERTLSVGKASQTISVNPIPNKMVTDGSFSVTATTTSGLPLAYSVISGPATISGNTITLTGSSGVVEVVVSQAGNSNYLEAEASTSFDVLDPDKADQTITFAAISDKAYGDIFTLGASSSSGLLVAYEVVDGPATLNGSALTLNGLGSVTVRATQAGDDDYNPAAQVSRSFEVGKAMLTVTAENKQMTYGDVLPDFTYTVTGFVNSETADVIAGSIEATTEASASSDAGEYTITVSGGNAGNYELSYVNGTLSVAKATQTITFEAIDNQVLSTGSLTLSATASSGLAVNYEVSGPATLAGTTLTFTGAGDITVTASQTGNVNYMAAEALPRTFTVTDDTPVDPVKEDQTISFEAIADKTFGDAAFDLTAAASSGLPVSYTTTGPATVSGSTVTITGAGSVTITATQTGDENFNAAADVSQSFTVNKATATITLSDLEQEADNTPKTPTVVTDPSGLQVVFTFNGETIIPVAAGSYTVVAAINDANYQGSAEATFVLNEILETGAGDDLLKVDIGVYPNPVADYLTIEISESHTKNEMYSARLFSLNGHELISQKFFDPIHILNLQQQVSGIYLLVITGGEGVLLKRVKVKKE